MRLLEEIHAAEQRIRPHIRETYLEYSPFFSEMTGASVWFKLENLQLTGSFKVRGAMNKVLSLDEESRSRGVVAASTGNHGAGVAFSLRTVQTRGIVFAPNTAAPGKVEAMRRLGAEVRFHGEDSYETEVHARKYAADHGMTYISPYNDLQVVAGQGTVGVELVRQLDRIDTVVVALGGGGLISGIGCRVKEHFPATQMVACSPENSQVMIQSLRAGEILNLPSQPTLSDGTAGGVEPGAVTFDFCQQFADDFETATEDEIAAALKQFVSAHHLLVEGSAAMVVACLLKRGPSLAGQNVVAVLCGANIDMATLARLVG